ncbi:hypothetical protein SISSUDRAFT_1067556, partial [Sistotremastrum suecicum HHB10207 ss-3]
DLLVINFLRSLIPSLPSTFTVPRSLDLAPTLSLLLRYQSDIKYSLPRYSETLIFFLDHGGFESLSSLRPAYDFFQLCLELSSDDNLKNTKIRDRAKFYLEQHGALVALPPPSPQDLQILVDALQCYHNNPTSKTLEECFVDGVKELDSLCRESKQADVKVVLSHVDRNSLLELILQNLHFSGQHISTLIPLVIEGNELEHIHAASALLANIPPVAPSDGDLPILAFLASLIPFLPSDYVVPPEFDLSQTLTLFTDSPPDRQTWRKNSETLMHYLHRGAFDALSDPDSVRDFLEICADPDSWWFRHWSKSEKTSESTRERAIELKKKLPALAWALDAAQRLSGASSSSTSPVIDDPRNPLDSGEEVQPRLPTPRTWDAFARRLGYIWRKMWRARTVAAAGDVEMALRDQSET